MSKSKWIFTRIFIKISIFY